MIGMRPTGVISGHHPDHGACRLPHFSRPGALQPAAKRLGAWQPTGRARTAARSRMPRASFHSLPLSLSPSLPLSLSPSLPLSLSPSLPLSHSPSLPLSPSLSPSLAPSLPRSLAPRSRPPSLPPGGQGQHTLAGAIGNRRPHVKEPPPAHARIRCHGPACAAGPGSRLWDAALAHEPLVGPRVTVSTVTVRVTILDRWQGREYRIAKYTANLKGDGADNSSCLGARRP